MGSLAEIAWVNDSLSTQPLKESVFVRTSKGYVYRSIDLVKNNLCKRVFFLTQLKGKTWVNVLPDLPGSEVKVDGGIGVTRMYSTQSDVVFVGA